MRTRILLLTLAVLTLASPSFAQRKEKRKKKNKGNSSTTAPEKKKDIASTVKAYKAFPGLFPVYQDTISGDLYLNIPKDKLGKEFIYFSQVSDGTSPSGYFRGSYRGSKIFKVEKYFDKIELQLENTSYYYDSTNAISKSAKANINTPIIFSEKISIQDSTGYLIKANDLFLGEAFNQVKPSSFPGNGFGFNLGGISKERSKITRVKNYPENTDIFVSIGFNNPYPINGGDRSTTDARFVNVALQHSIIAMPENNYKPRMDDPRVGYFTTQTEDMTNLSSKPYRDYIHRWHLEKKNPTLALSEPVKPITWWIENTTPVEFREIIRTAVLRWNLVFEKAGFINAVVVNIQPDDADWDAEDIRYNVLRWTASPSPRFGGYGPSFVNPRTGEILGADIMLEYVYFGNILKRLDRFDRAGLDFLDMEAFNANDPHTCTASAGMHNQLIFGMASLKSNGINAKDSVDLIRQSLSRLVLHEVGHTMGLNHNMKGSSIFSPAEIKNKQRIADGFICNSIMEYPSINNALNPADQVQFYDEFCGPYDHWAIEFAYSEALSNEAEEQARLAKILSRSSEPMLAFGNDADDMRTNGFGIDPKVNIYDLSSDPVAYGAERIELVNQLMPKLLIRYKKEGDNYHEMRSAYLALTGEIATQLRIMTRQIGGVYVDRSFVGSEKVGSKPFTPVPYAIQKQAMAQLKKYAFGKTAFNEPTNLYNYLQQQRRGFNLGGPGEDPKIHDRFLTVQNDLLAQLLHPNVLERISNTALYGNEYALDEYMTDLSSAIIDEDIAGNISTIRQNLQVSYTKALIGIVESKNYDYVAQSNALTQLQNIKKKASAATAGNGLSKAHRNHLNFIITKALSAKM